MSENNVIFYKTDSINKINNMDSNSFIVNINDDENCGIYLGNNTGSPVLVANKIEKVSQINNDLNFVTDEQLNNKGYLSESDLEFATEDDIDALFS